MVQAVSSCCVSSAVSCLEPPSQEGMATEWNILFHFMAVITSHNANSAVGVIDRQMNHNLVWRHAVYVYVSQFLFPFLLLLTWIGQHGAWMVSILSYFVFNSTCLFSSRSSQLFTVPLSPIHHVLQWWVKHYTSSFFLHTHNAAYFPFLMLCSRHNDVVISQGHDQLCNWQFPFPVLSHWNVRQKPPQSS